MRLTLLVMTLLAGCGDPNGAPYRLEGECVAPAGTAVTPVRTASWSCDRQAPPVIDSQAQLDALDPLCTFGDGRTVDFTTQRVVLVSGHGGNGGRTTINFIVDTGAQLELGLTYVPSGAQFPDFALILPRSDHPVVVRNCNQVCVRDCQTLP